MRTLAVFVTLACVYFGSWQWLRDRAEQDVARAVGKNKWLVIENRPHVPFIITVSQNVEIHDPSPIDFGRYRIVKRRDYYAWVFGWTVKLPYTTHENTADPPVYVS